MTPKVQSQNNVLTLQEPFTRTPSASFRKRRESGDEQPNSKKPTEAKKLSTTSSKKPSNPVPTLKSSGSCTQRKNGYPAMFQAPVKSWNGRLPRTRITRISGWRQSKSKPKTASPKP